ncbi:hypothetical protein ALUC_80506A [Aspergillus luchuensis]|nr:hypothetical protein ALUC_80506A [Aspergillus luchuensis]
MLETILEDPMLSAQLQRKVLQCALVATQPLDLFDAVGVVVKLVHNEREKGRRASASPTASTPETMATQ